MPTTDELLNDLTNILRPIVAAIEASPPLTRNHYDSYMVALDRIANKLSRSNRSTSLYLAIGIALQRAGAPKAGVLAALQSMGYLPSLEAPEPDDFNRYVAGDR
jgi:hypothetical protein